MDTSLERELPLAAATRRAEEFVRSRGWHAELHPVRDDVFGVWQCRLVGDGETLPGGRGAGKGPPQQARIGALFEAIEHHLTHVVGHYQPQLARAGELAAPLTASGDLVGLLLAEQAETPLACLPYLPLAGSEAPLLLPLALAVPAYETWPGDAFDYTPLEPYATNNGSAIGSTRAEAVLHALNEVIERDALSLLLCAAFLHGHYEPRLLDPASLPPDLCRLLNAVETELGEEIALISATTDLGIPTVLAYIAPHSGRGRAARGMGTSVSEPHAVERAISELAQLKLLAGDQVAAAEQDGIDYLHDLEATLADCAAFDLTGHLRVASYRPIIPALPTQPVGTQLHGVLGALRARGFVPYCHQLPTTVTGPLAVVHVAVPGLERIMTLLHGRPALPGHRGLAIVENGMPTLEPR